jgi:hypothetical protein
MIKLFLAIVAVESGGNPWAVGDQGRSVGPAQITAGVVSDCNRIAGTHYTLSDRNNLQKSQEMFLIYTEHYGRKFGVPVSDETRARIWNKGPNGPMKQTTQKYWQKIKAKL